jgi:hypothetical protein
VATRSRISGHMQVLPLSRALPRSAADHALLGRASSRGRQFSRNDIVEFSQSDSAHSFCEVWAVAVETAENVLSIPDALCH